MLSVGQKVRIIPTVRGNKVPSHRKEKIGVIEQITSTVIIIKTRNYRLGFNLADVIIPNEYYIAIWNRSNWCRVKPTPGLRSFKELEDKVV